MSDKDEMPVEGPGAGTGPRSSAYRSGPEGQQPAPGPPASSGSSESADALTENGGREGADTPGRPPVTESEGAEAVEGDLDALLEDVKRERDEYLDLARRAKADFENFRKRAARDATVAERRGKVGLARELLPAIDNLERALRAAGVQPLGDPAAAGRDAGETAGSVSEEVSAPQALARGVALVHGELVAALARVGVESYDPAGERFDPAHSEAISTAAASEDVAAGVVIETLERGYRLNGQVIRPARVIVSL